MPPPPGGGYGGGGGQVAQLEAQMAAATASGNFEMCIARASAGLDPSTSWELATALPCLSPCLALPLSVFADPEVDGRTPLCAVRGQIKQAKRSELEAQINAAAASNQFERCIQLREELNRLV